METGSKKTNGARLRFALNMSIMSDYDIEQDPYNKVKYAARRENSDATDHTHLARETSLEVVVNGISHSLLMQTPGAERELVTGYLYTEGLIENSSDIGELTFEPGPSFLQAPGIKAMAKLPGLNALEALPERPSISLASCGLCGKEALEKIGRGLSRIKSKQHFDWAVVHSLIKDLRNHQPLYELTRGVHAAALYDSHGNFQVCYEDVGRHNAMDKVIGHSLLHGWTFNDKIAVLSGRASLEIVMKTARAGLPLLLCFSPAQPSWP